MGRRQESRLIALPAELRTERLLLRPYRPEDAPLLAAAVAESRARLRQWLDWVDGFEAAEDARFYIAGAIRDWSRRRELFFGVFARESGRYLGNTGLHNIDWDLRSFEIGYWLREGAEGAGFMSEAVFRLTQFSFDDLAANRVEIRCDPRNRRSRRLAERLGFPYEGCLRNSRRDPDGRPRDSAVYAMTPADWEAGGGRRKAGGG